MRALAPWSSGRLPAPLVQLVVHLSALLPLAVLVWDTYAGNLSVNPIQDITLRTGKLALIFLVASLACTPANILFGFKPALRWRRPLGLYAFMYAALHFLTFIGLDYGFDPALIREAIFEKRYALAGFAAFMILLPLAITSTRGWMKRLGKNWKRLHKLVYIAAGFVIIHYIWLVKSDIRPPALWGAGVALLLALRLPAVRRHITSRLRRSRPARSRQRVKEKAEAVTDQA